MARAQEIGVDRNTLIKHLIKSESSQGIKAQLKLVASEPGISVSASEWDADPWVLNTQLGIIDLRTGELQPHDPRHLITKLAPVNYHEDAQCPRWMSFLTEIMDGSQALIDYLGRICGMCVTGVIEVQELYVFFGGGANGKNVFIDTVAGILGDYAGAAPPQLLTTRMHEEHPTEIADLQGKRLVFASETEENAKLRIQLVKRLTGDPTLKGRRMRQDYFEFPRTNKTVMITNNKPVINESTNAVWRRIRLVPFNVTIPEHRRDPQLTQKLRAEWPGILAWIVRGCLDWQLNGMQTPAEVLAASQSYQDEQNPVGDFVQDRLNLVGDNLKIGRNELYSAYLSYCNQVGEKHPLDRRALFDRIRRLNGVKEDQWRPMGITVPIRGFRGVALADTEGYEDSGVEEVAGCSRL